MVWPAISSPTARRTTQQVLSDCGADDNFIDTDLAVQSGVPTETLSNSKAFFTLNGELLAQVTHRTAPLTLQLSGNHHETIPFFVITSANSPVALSLPWLELYNPHINWSTSTITNWSLFCHFHCLCLASPATVFQLPEAPNPIDLFSVPTDVMTSVRFSVKTEQSPCHHIDHMTVVLTFSLAPPYLLATCTTC